MRLIFEGNCYCDNVTIGKYCYEVGSEVNYYYAYVTIAMYCYEVGSEVTIIMLM